MGDEIQFAEIFIMHNSPTLNVRFWQNKYYG